MNRSEVISLAQELGTQQADAIALDKFFDDVIADMCRAGWLCVASILPASANQFEYDPPERTVELWYVLYDDRMLYGEALRALEGVNAHWRNERGTPRSFVIEDQSNHKFRLYPAPDRTSKDFIPIFGAPLGLDYPNYSVVTITSETRDDIPAWLGMPVAFELLYREFVRESDHTDLVFAGVCKKLATTLLAMVSA